MKNHSITFSVWGNDPPLEIQLEPEAFTFIVNPNEDVTFVVKNPQGDFSWGVRWYKDGIQLFPETRGCYERIELFRNGKLTDELNFLYDD